MIDIADTRKKLLVPVTNNALVTATNHLLLRA